MVPPSPLGRYFSKMKGEGERTTALSIFFKDFQSVTPHLKRRGECREIVNLRLFGLERLITCRAVKAIIKFCVLGLVTIFTYQREAYSENPV